MMPIGDPETSIDWICGSKTATVYSNDLKYYRRYKQLYEERADEIDLRLDDEEQHAILMRVPVSWIRVVPKKVRELTDEQKEELADRMKKVRQLRGTKNEQP